MMRRLLGLFGFALAEFGGLVCFWAVSWAFGLKPAIAATLVFVLADILRRRRAGLPFSRIFMITSGLAIASGTIDLTLASPVLIRYEAVATNLVFAAAFALGARGPKTMIQEIAEERQGAPFPERADIARFFRLFTLAWALYFLGKAGLYLWLVETLPFEQALLLRSIIGTASLGAMALLSLLGPRLFRLLQRMGLLGPAAPVVGGADCPYPRPGPQPREMGDAQGIP